MVQLNYQMGIHVYHIMVNVILNLIVMDLIQIAIQLLFQMLNVNLGQLEHVLKNYVLIMLVLLI